MPILTYAITHIRLYINTFCTDRGLPEEKKRYIVYTCFATILN